MSDRSKILLCREHATQVRSLVHFRFTLCSAAGHPAHLTCGTYQPTPVLPLRPTTSKDCCAPSGHPPIRRHPRLRCRARSDLCESRRMWGLNVRQSGYPRCGGGHGRRGHHVHRRQDPSGWVKRSGQCHHRMGQRLPNSLPAIDYRLPTGRLGCGRRSIPFGTDLLWWHG